MVGLLAYTRGFPTRDFSLGSWTRGILVMVLLSEDKNIYALVR